MFCTRANSTRPPPTCGPPLVSMNKVLLDQIVPSAQYTILTEVGQGPSLALAAVFVHCAMYSNSMLASGLLPSATCFMNSETSPLSFRGRSLKSGSQQIFSCFFFFFLNRRARTTIKMTDSLGKRCLTRQQPSSNLRTHIEE